MEDVIFCCACRKVAASPFCFSFVCKHACVSPLVRRSVRLTVVSVVWLSELRPHGFSKRSWSKPGLAHNLLHPLLLLLTRTKWVVRWSDRKDRQTDFLFGDKQENDTHIKEEEGDRLVTPHTTRDWKSSSRVPTTTQIGRHRDRQREEWTLGDKSCLDRR